MAASVSTLRSRSQDSPTLWLSVLAGSLALHLVLLLAGRWYLSQTASDRAGSPAPLEFVEIDPNAPPLKQPVAPPKPATANSTPRTSTAPETTTPAQSQEPSIQSLARQVTPERSQSQAPVRSEPAASPKPQTKPDSPSTLGNLPSNPTQSTRNPAIPSDSVPSSNRPFDPANSGANPTRNPASNSSTNSNLSGTDSSGANSSSSPNPQTSTPAAPGTDPANSDSSKPATSGLPLPSNGVFSAQMSAIETEANPIQQDQKDENTNVLSVDFKVTELPPIELSIPAPNQVLDLRVIVQFYADGTVFSVEVLDDSPTLLSSPNLKEASQSIAQALLTAPDPANPDKPLSLFNVTLKSTTNPTDLIPRIIRLRVNSTGQSAQIAP